MALAAMGAGVLAAPNNSLAGGPEGLATFFLTGFLAALAATTVGAPLSWAMSATGTPAARTSAHKRLVRRIPPSALRLRIVLPVRRDPAAASICREGGQDSFFSPGTFFRAA